MNTASVEGRHGADVKHLDVAHILAPVARSVGLARVARSALLGLTVGGVLGGSVLVAEHLHAFGSSVQVAVGALVLGVMAGAVFGLTRWPRSAEAARIADRYFGLDDRLTTALELHTNRTPVADLQRGDVMRQIAGLNLAQSRGPWLKARDGVPAVIVAVTFAAVLIFAPSASHHAAVAAPSTLSTQRHAAANRVKALASQLHIGLTPAQLQNPALRRLDNALAKLRHQLVRATTKQAALRAVSATQSQIQHLALGLHPVNARAVSKLNASLSRYLGKSQSRPSSGTASRSAAATAHALSRLAQSLQHLNPAQRAALARALARAANSTPNNALRSALRQAAQALANADVRSARSALQQSAQSLSQSASEQTALSRASALGSQLGALKNQIAGTGAAPSALPATARQGSSPGNTGKLGKSGRARGTGKGTGKGAGRGLGQGRGSGKGTGARGNGTGRGQGTGATLGRGNSGARGKGGSGRAARTRAGRTVTVFVPGKQGKGATIVRSGPQGTPLSGNLVPYQQVVVKYAQSAHQALDRSALPPSLANDVRRYFSTLSQ